MEPRLCLFLLCWTFSTSANQCGSDQQQKYHLLSDFDNLTITTLQGISELPSQTQHTCAHACHDNNDCTMFHININGGQCLLYSASFPSVINSGYLDGFRLYGRESDMCPVPQGYIAFDNPPACYRLSLDKKNWSGAKAVCEDEGGHLVVLEDVDKWQQVMAAIAEFPSQEAFYVGLDDRDKEGKHVWADGRTLLNNSSWAHEEPSLGVTEDCVVMHKRGLSDIDCSRTFYYMCQIDIM